MKVSGQFQVNDTSSNADKITRLARTAILFHGFGLLFKKLFLWLYKRSYEGV